MAISYKRPPSRVSPKAPRRTWGRRVLRWVGWTFLFVLVTGLVGAGALAGVMYSYISDPSLPSLDNMVAYRPQVVTKIYARDGRTLLGEVFGERRTVVPLDKIPKHFIYAVLDAEDAQFYEHHGLNFWGMLRAVSHNLLHPNANKQGGSTITQQLIKSYVLKNNQRTFKRKVQDGYLAYRYERSSSPAETKRLKDNILYIYLNESYFGNQRYGVEEAAQYYFGKPISQVNVGEAAQLASLLKKPEMAHGTVPAHLEQWKQRQQYVLRRMVEMGHLTQEQAQVYRETPLRNVKAGPTEIAPEFVNEADRYLKEVTFKDNPEKRWYFGGRIVTTCDAELQQAARMAVEKDLQNLDGRSGFRKPLRHLKEKQIPAYIKVLDASDKALPNRVIEGLVTKVYDGDAVHRPQALVLLGKGVLGRLYLPIEKGVDRYNPEGLLPSKRFQAGDVVRVHVGDHEPKAKPVATPKPVMAPILPVVPEVASQTSGPARLSKDPRAQKTDKGSAAKPGPVITPALPPATGARPATQVLPAPAPVLVEEEDTVSYVLALEQGPQAAVVVIDPSTRHVLAMVGGYRSDRTQLNRAIQSSRQPGSAFKVAVYAAALASKAYTPATIVIDEPKVFEMPGQAPYKPQNAESDQFAGPVRLRVALAHSYNTVAVQLLYDLKFEPVINMARNLGIEAKIDSVLPLALGGALEVTTTELTNSYATLAAEGWRADPQMLLSVGNEVIAPSGRQRTISADLAYQTSDLLRAPIEEGTAGSINGKLKGKAAGKTGTTSNEKDAWFVGYTKDFVIGVWVGYDLPRSMGKYGYGGKAAVPTWLHVMQAALQGRKPTWFNQPPGVVVAKIDPATGKLASPGGPSIEEVFLLGTVPTEQALAPGETDPALFNMGAQ